MLSDKNIEVYRNMMLDNRQKTQRMHLLGAKDRQPRAARSAKKLHGLWLKLSFCKKDSKKPGIWIKI